MTQTVLFNDFETFSKADIKTVGGYRYGRDVSTKVLMCAYAFDDEPVRQWVPAHGEKMPRDLHDAIRDPDVLKSAWNASFEKIIWEYVLGYEIDDETWRCSMVRAMSLSLPGGLEDAGPILNLTADKQKMADAKKLIRLFCKPQKPTKKNPFTKASKYTHPDEWETFLEYNRQDVVAERAIWKRTKRWDMPEHEWQMWALDQEINRDGIPINMTVVENAIEFTEDYRAARKARMRRLTGVENVNSNPQLLKWLRENGYRFADLKKGHVARGAEDKEMSDNVREVLEIRQEISKTSVDKYYAMRRAQVDGNIQGCFQFAGAQRTWRWSGRLIQPQNLSRPAPWLEDQQEQAVRHLEKLSPRALKLIYDKPMDMLATCIRPTIQAPEGYVMISADENAIENRCLGWLSGDEKILDVFRNDRDPYVDFATYMFGGEYEELWEEYKPSDGSKGDKSKRTTAKPGVLGCGYMLSAGEEHENEQTGEIEATGLLGYGRAMGVNLTLEQAKLSVKVWRETFVDAVEYWWEIEKAAKLCVRTGKPTWAREIGFDISGPMLRMLLPSGRALHYVRPQIVMSTQYWCNVKRKYLPRHLCKEVNLSRTKVKENLTYEGLDDKKRWSRIQTHPGKITENADQAVSRDVLAEGMRRFRARVSRNVARIRLHVHDEIVTICKEDHADKVKKILEECMTEPMPWAPDFPLGVGEGASVCRVWIKD